MKTTYLITATNFGDMLNDLKRLNIAYTPITASLSSAGIRQGVVAADLTEYERLLIARLESVRLMERPSDRYRVED